jgi:hypothetical protein
MGAPLMAISYVLLTVSILMTLLLLYFIWFELGVYRATHGKMKLKFVILTLAASSAQICSSWINTYYYFNNLPVFTLLNAPNAPDVILNILGAIGDVYLLILRIQGLLMTSILLSRLIKVLGICFSILCSLSIALTITAVVLQSGSTVFSILFSTSTVATGVVLLTLDIVSTFAFARLVYEQHSTTKEYIAGSEETKVISVIGIIICGVTLLNVVLFVSSSFANQHQRTLWTAFVICGNCIAALWILMKIRIDTAKQGSFNSGKKSHSNHRNQSERYTGMMKNVGSSSNPKESLLTLESSGDMVLSPQGQSNDGNLVFSH